MGVLNISMREIREKMFVYIFLINSKNNHRKLVFIQGLDKQIKKNKVLRR